MVTQSINDVVFLLIPIVSWLTLGAILTVLYVKDRNKRKFVFALGAFIAAFSFNSAFIESLGYHPLFPNSEWLFVPIALAILIAASTSLLKTKNFNAAFTVFIAGSLASLAAFFLQIHVPTVKLALTVAFMATAVPMLIYIFVKSRDSSDLYFLFATLCFLSQGLVMDLGTSVDIPVMLALFGVVFIGLMFNRPNEIRPSSLHSFIVLEKQLNEANQNLKTMEAKLLKAERLAAIGELAGIVGHDLRNPLQGMMGATHYLKMHAAEKADATCIEMLEEIDDCIRRSDKIVSDLVEYSRVIDIQPTQIMPKMLVEQALNELIVPTNVKIENHVQTAPLMAADENMMRRAFSAIIKNAFDAMPEGGELSIKSHVKGEVVVFSFKDSGVGMDEATLEKIWTPLFTTKAKGMGFGLAVCRRFVDAHGGKVHVQSKQGKGTTVTVTVPLQYREPS